VKLKIFIELSKMVLEQIDLLAGPKRSRSIIIERVLRKFLIERKTTTRHARDLQQINRGSAKFNLEAAEVLEYQRIEQKIEDIEDQHLAEDRIKKRGRTYTTAQIRSELGLDD
jgi:hypothetical protein